MSKHPPAPAETPAAAAPEANSGKPNFQGKYKFVRNEDLEDYLAALGFSWVTRKVALHKAPELDITQEGDKFTLKQNCMTVARKEVTFTVGEEFEDTQHNGNIMKVTPVWDGAKLLLTLEPKEEGKGVAEKQTRELHEDELIVTFEIGDSLARRIFKKIG